MWAKLGKGAGGRVAREEEEGLLITCTKGKMRGKEKRGEGKRERGELVAEHEF